MSPIEEEIRRCKADFRYFAERYLWIVHRAKVWNLALNTAQERVLDALERSKTVKVLKARKHGISTLVAAYFFWRALFNAYERVLVLAHTADAAKKIFRIYRTFYELLPPEMRAPLVPGRAKFNLEFADTGSFITVQTAGSESARPESYSCIHASEAAWWERMQLSVASIFSTAWEDAQIVVETTANGINSFYEFWANENDYMPVFLPWTLHPEYARQEPPPSALREQERLYLASHNLTQDQAAWFVWYLRTRCNNSMDIFLQEMPATAEEAFRSSGAPFFRTQPADVEKIAAITDYGWRWFETAPNPYRQYLFGVDVATGTSTGDFSSICVLDMAGYEQTKRLVQVGMFYARVQVHDFIRVLLDALEQWKGFATVERNSFGLSVCQALVDAGWPYLYRFVKRAATGYVTHWTEEVGFKTSTSTRAGILFRLQDFVQSERLVVKDPRLAYEMRHFQYDERGLPNAQTGFHDDAIWSTALAIEGLEQAAGFVEERVRETRPVGLREILRYEQDTGKRYDPHDPAWGEWTGGPAPLQPVTAERLRYA